MKQQNTNHTDHPQHEQAIANATDLLFRMILNSELYESPISVVEAALDRLTQEYAGRFIDSH